MAKYYDFDKDFLIELVAAKGECRNGRIPAGEVTPADVGQITRGSQFSRDILNRKIDYLFGR